MLNSFLMMLTIHQYAFEIERIKKENHNIESYKEHMVYHLNFLLVLLYWLEYCEKKYKQKIEEELMKNSFLIHKNSKFG